MDFIYWFWGIFIAAIVLASIWGIKCYYQDKRRWNGGKCTECGAKLELTKFVSGNPIYKCPKCGHEVHIWWSRTINTF